MITVRWRCSWAELTPGQRPMAGGLGLLALSSSGAMRDHRIMWIDQRGSEVLTVPECHRLLAVAAQKGGIGRLAVGGNGAPIVVPVNFAVHDRQVLIRIGTGTLAASAIGHLVAFEADEVDRITRQAWSVLVRGLARTAEPADLFDPSHLPHPLAPRPGNTMLVVRPDVVSGRRFALKVDTKDAGESSSSDEPQ